MPPIKRPAKKVVKKAVKKTVKKTVKKAVKRPAPGAKKPTVKKAARPVAKKAARPVVKPRIVGAGVGKPVLGKAIEKGLEGRTNQDIINVIYKAADELKMPAWTLLSKVKLEHLVDARTAPYTGPAMKDLPGITPDQKAVILKVLGSYVRPKR